MMNMRLIQTQMSEDLHQLMGLFKLGLPCVVNIGCVEFNYLVRSPKIKGEVINLTKAFVPIEQKMLENCN